MYKNGKIWYSGVYETVTETVSSGFVTPASDSAASLTDASTLTHHRVAASGSVTETVSSGFVTPTSGSAASLTDASTVAPIPTFNCPVCVANVADTAIISCGHCCCSRCINMVMSQNTGASSKCPVCRAVIQTVMRLYFVA